MSTLNTIITAIGGAGALSGLVTAIVQYIKSKTAANERKAEAHKDHKAQGERMLAMQASIDALASNLSAAQASEAAMRAERDTLRAERDELSRENKSLRAKNDRLQLAIPPLDKKEKEKP